MLFAAPPLFAGSADSLWRESALQKYVVSVSGEEPLKSSLFGMLAVTCDGDTLAEFSSLRKMPPASNLKLITTGVALSALGPDFRFKTKIGYSGEIADGTLHGDLYIIGQGDPTIASEDSFALPSDSLFALWQSVIENAGITKIKGCVIGDGSYFDGPIEKSSWAYDDLGTDYGTGGNALCFYENVQKFRVSPGTNIGSPVKAEPLFPSAKWMTFVNKAVTSKAGSGDNVTLVNTDMCKIAELRGDFAIDKAPKTELFSNKFGDYTCALYFDKYLNDNGLKVHKDPRSVSWDQDKPALTILDTTYSPPLSDILKATNYKSDNFYAETLLRTLGKTFTGSATYDSSYVAESAILSDLGVDISYGAQIRDGSGLSRHNYIAPDFMCRYLKAMAESPVFGTFLRTLPQPGSATLGSRLRDVPSSSKRRVWMKSGSMNGVLCYSGYILPENGCKEDIVVFSIMTADCTDSPRNVGKIIDGLLVRLLFTSVPLRDY